GDMGARRLARLNDALVRIERAFLDPRGLPGRPWFRHVLYAPGLTTGYAPWPFPGIRQALEDRDPDLLGAQMDVLIERIEAATRRIAAAASIAAGGLGPAAR
ncbi:MAG: transferrin receptor-like dimerization domain-containing protein, partial [Acidobacteriota bacterium]